MCFDRDIHSNREREKERDCCRDAYTIRSTQVFPPISCQGKIKENSFMAIYSLQARNVICEICTCTVEGMGIVVEVVTLCRFTIKLVSCLFG